MQQRTLQILGVLLVLGGASLGIWGVSWYQSGGDCHQYYLHVSTNASDYADSPAVDYENLTADQQRAFRQTLAAEDNASGVSRSYFGQPTRVRYEGRTYLVVTASNDGCQPRLNFLLKVVPLMAGGGFLLGGLSILYKARQ